MQINICIETLSGLRSLCLSALYSSRLLVRLLAQTLLGSTHASVRISVYSLPRTFMLCTKPGSSAYACVALRSMPFMLCATASCTSFALSAHASVRISVLFARPYLLCQEVICNAQNRGSVPIARVALRPRMTCRDTWRSRVF